MVNIWDVITNKKDPKVALAEGADELGEKVTNGFFGWVANLFKGALGFIGSMILPVLGIMAVMIGIKYFGSEEGKEQVEEGFAKAGDTLKRGWDKLAGLFDKDESVADASDKSGHPDGDEDRNLPEADSNGSNHTVEPKVYEYNGVETKLIPKDQQNLENITNKKGAHWVSVDSKGNPVAGNKIHTKGDLMSTGKLISAGVLKSFEGEEGGLPEGFLDNLNDNMTVGTRFEGQRPLVDGWLQNSSNIAADRILGEVSKEMGISKDAVIDKMNNRIQNEWGYKNTEIANLSGLTTSYDGVAHRYVRPGADSASTPYELAVLTMKIGRESPDLQKYASADSSRTGLQEHSEFEFAKSGTGNGDEAKTSGITKSMIGYDEDTGGAVAVLEQGVSSRELATEWHNTINQATAGMQQAAVAADSVKPSQKVITSPEGKTNVIVLDVGHGGKLTKRDGADFTREDYDALTLDSLQKGVKSGDIKIITEGYDPGAISPVNGLKEFEANLYQAVATKDKLTADGWDAKLFIGKDGSKIGLGEALNARVQFADENEAMALLSFHNNASNGTQKGTEAFFGDNSESEAMANASFSAFQRADMDARRVAHQSQTHVGDLGIFRGHKGADRALVVYEGVFLDHPEDVKKAKDTQFLEQYSSAIASSVNQYATGKGYSQDYILDEALLDDVALDSEKIKYNASDVDEEVILSGLAYQQQQQAAMQKTS